MNVPVYTEDPTVFQGIKNAFEESGTRLTVSSSRDGESVSASLGTALPFLSIVDASSMSVSFDDFIGDAVESLMDYRKVMILIVSVEEFKNQAHYLNTYPFVISVLAVTELTHGLGSLLTLFNANPHILINLEMQARLSSSINTRFVFIGYLSFHTFCLSSDIALDRATGAY